MPLLRIIPKPRTSTEVMEELPYQLYSKIVNIEGAFIEFQNKTKTFKDCLHAIELLIQSILTFPELKKHLDPRIYTFSSLSYEVFAIYLEPLIPIHEDLMNSINQLNAAVNAPILDISFLQSINSLFSNYIKMQKALAKYQS